MGLPAGSVLRHMRRDGLCGLSRRQLVVAPEAGSSLRAAIDEGAAQLDRGDVDAALRTLEGARALAVDTGSNDTDRAALLFHLGDAELARGAVADACSLLTLALDVCNRTLRAERPAPRAHLRAPRTLPSPPPRVVRRAQPTSSARSSSPSRSSDDGTIAQASLQASIIAEREGQWIMAQFYAERARELFVQNRRRLRRRPLPEQPRRARRSCSAGRTTRASS